MWLAFSLVERKYTIMKKQLDIVQLKTLNIWINWKYEQREGKNTKVPLNPNIENSFAKTNDTSTWGSFDVALSNAQNYDVGIGIMFSPLDNDLVLAGIDIDAHNVDSNPLTNEILEMFAETYIEISPSGKGYHILFAVRVDDIFSMMGGMWDKQRYYMHNPQNDIECYVAGVTNRYFTYTENSVNDNPLVDMTDTFKDFLEKYMQKSDHKKDKTYNTLNVSTTSSSKPPKQSLNDIDDILNIARCAENGSKFSALYDRGDTSKYGGDDSAADMALCNMLAWWLQGDYDAIDNAFRKSALYRPKWEREDYRRATINKAIARCNGKFYSKSSKLPLHEVPVNSDYPFILYDKDGNPDGVSVTQLAKFFRENENFYFINTGGDKPPCLLYDYNKGVYKPIDKNLLMGEIKKPIEAVDENLVKSNILEETYRLLLTDRCRISADSLNADQDIIIFANGVLKLSTMELLPHSPTYLCTIQIPCDYNPNAGDCPIFDDFIKTLSGGDEKVEQLLWEYFALAISNIYGYHTKQALFLVGESNSGKSQYLKTISEFIGIENFATIDLRRLEQRFGTFPLFGKRAAGCGDMRVSSIPELNTFKMLTGGDQISFEQKGRDAFTSRFNGVLIFAANEMPAFGGDKGEHVYKRMLIVPCPNIIPEEKQDRKLIEKFGIEREAIIAKSMVYLQRFIKRGNKFEEPAICSKLRNRYKLINEPILLFLNDCTVQRDNADHSLITTRDQMYKAYCHYSEENNYMISNRQEFRKVLAKNGVADHKLKNNRCYSIELTAEARTQYLSTR